MAGIPDTLKGRSFTRVADWSPDELATALDLADELKVERARRHELRILPGRTVGLIFRKPSTRTRISSEVGIAELGGMALYVPAADLHLSRGESTRDTALVLSRFLSAITIRTFDQAEVDEFAEHATIPIVNGLTDTSHPLQALADAMTIRERFGTLEGVRVAYLGDGNNVCHSLMRIAARTGMHLVAASPEGYLPDPGVVDSCREDASASGGSIEVVVDPGEAVAGARVLYTDVWTSMGQEDEHEQHLRISPRTASTAKGSRRRRRTRWRSTACPHTWARRSPPTSSTATARSSGTRPRTASTSTRPCSPSRCDEVRGRRPRGPGQPAAQLAAGLRNVAVVVEEEDPDDPDLYGVFEGVPLTDGGPAPGELPNRIAIFRRPLEADFEDVDELRDEIRITVLHELGHYFGLDEDRLAELGYE